MKKMQIYSNYSDLFAFIMRNIWDIVLYYKVLF